MTPARSPTRTALLARAILFGMAPHILAWLVYNFAYRAGAVAGSIEQVYFPDQLGSAALLVFPALSLGLIIALVQTNTRPWKYVFRPSRARLIGAVLPTLVTPVGLFSWQPIALGWLVIAEAGSNGLGILKYVLVVLPVLVIWHLISGIFVSGLRSKTLRFLAFLLVWWSIYISHAMISGTYYGNI